MKTCFQLIGFTDGETTASYKYNVSGLRYEKTVDGQTINHVWNGSQQIIADVIDNQFYEADCYIRGTNLVAKYNYRNGDKSEYTYYIQNAHGDVVNLTDKDGKVTRSYKYDAFGVELNLDTNDVNVFRFCGEYFDTETGTVYLRARYYQASIGRFISRDSFAGRKSDPLSLNLYTYCHNNPIYYIDPSGHGIKSILNKLTQKIETAVGEILFPKPKSDSVIHSTPLNPQEESNWCWNACSQMFAATYGYTNHNQTEAADNLFPEEEDRDLPANMLQVKSTIEFYSDNNLKTVRSGVLSETRLAKILEVRGPVIIMRGVYNEEGKRNGGHDSIIYGYEFNEANNSYDFYINDPWSPNKGNSYVRQYQEIVDGSSTGIDNKRWEESVYAAWYIQ